MAMSRLVVVSNRLPEALSGGRGFDLPAGGLVRVLFDALRDRRGGGLWVGWDPRARGRPRRLRHDGIERIGLPLPAGEVAGYYEGFCNQALWPILHTLPSRAEFQLADLASYRSAQERFAGVLRGELRRSDVVWIHDFHLLLLAPLLRSFGFRGRIGFFLHTPFPAPDVWALLPASEEMLVAFGAIDLVGVQTRRDQRHLRDALRPHFPRSAARPAPRVEAFPVGIQASEFEPSAATERRPKPASHLAQLVGGRKSILGVDRLDYSKGLIERFRAFERFLRDHPEWRRRVCLVQIASPSRVGLAWYRRERRELDLAAGRINGELGDVDWTPIVYLRRSFPRATLARLYRGADVGLVTPLRDGMNLVAKEFVAAQRASDPGALVLSRFAGAAESMTAALLVNPWVIEETAAAIRRALEMPLDERRSRQRALLRVVRRDSAVAWRSRFLAALGDVATR
jgi:trehalose 6-phosphate synthase